MSFRRSAGAWLVAVMALAGGCVTQGIPDWAKHVQPEAVDMSQPDEEVIPRLMAELQTTRLERSHVAPEQIALVGLRELEQGRLADAGLWLSIASYRYHQETMEAYLEGTAGLARLPYYVKPADYKRLVLAEIKRFAQLSFYSEVRAIEGRLRGQDDKEIALQDQLTTLGKTDPIDRESLRDVWAELQPKKAAQSQISRYPYLSEAFRARLRADAASDPEDHHPPNYLSITPDTLLKKEAVLAETRYFDPITSLGVVDGFPALRPAMIAALTANRPQTRANAAATLALAPTDETRTLLEARLAAETDPQARLVFAYALARHGVAEQVLPLTVALQACKGEGCMLPVMLVQWLPVAMKIDIDQTPLARVVADREQELTARLFAAGALRSIGRQKALDPASVEALIVAARFRFDDDVRLQEMASEAVAQAGALSRATVVARLGDGGATPTKNNDVLHPCGLLARLAEVSTADDLPLLRRMMTQFPGAEGIEPFFIAKAALNIRSPEASATLVNWFNAHQNLQTMIAVGLLSRGDIVADQFDRLIERGDVRTAITIKALRHDPDLQAKLIDGLNSDKIADKIQAAELAGTLGTGPDIVRRLQGLLSFRDSRYYPADALVRHTAMAALIARELRGPRGARAATGRASSAPAPAR